MQLAHGWQRKKLCFKTENKSHSTKSKCFPYSKDVERKKNNEWQEEVKRKKWATRTIEFIGQ